eukprot:TRINITY_DN78219_c0_g1_i1.p1 TRINITY_DN78219_c0_g1~~TRINITY_DN78219_c0_g1_i1.p1  ORF type:complete len:623 (+),score=87.64 TRINITY_DN78219_c0_g1_i1:104-1972(+)
MRRSALDANAGDPELPLGTYGAVAAGQESGQDADQLTDEQKAAQRGKPSLQDIPALFTPWLLFGMILIPTALMETHYLSLIAAVTSCVIACAFILFSRGLPWRMLALTSLALCGVGYAMGCYDSAKYVYPYHFYARSPSYELVDADWAPGSVADAGFLSFTAETHVDSTRSVGYVSGSTWCVAPIVSNDLSDSAGFWAVGKDCCRRQGLFRCGDARNRSTHTGIVIRDVSPILQDELPQYKKAAEMAAGTYGINMPGNPIFVRWNDTPENNENWYWDNAVSFALTAVSLFFLVPPLFLLVMKLAGTSLFGREGDDKWHPEKLDLMGFGFNFQKKLYPTYLQADLMYSRSFYTGEVIQDYIFHVANRHVYWSCLLCHPSHPYQKWERLIVAVTISAVVWFSTAAFTAFLGTSLGRTAFVVVMVLFLRNALQLLLMNVAIEASARDLEAKGVIGARTTRDISSVEVALLAAYCLGSVAFAIACSGLIGISDMSVGSALHSSLDVFGYIYVLDFTADLITPFLGHDAFHGVWTFGFFGRWRHERDEYESSKKDLMARQMSAQWTSLGAEVLGAKPQQGSARPQQSSAQSLKTARVGDQYMVPSGTLKPTTTSAPMFSQFAMKRSC